MCTSVTQGRLTVSYNFLRVTVFVLRIIAITDHQIRNQVPRENTQIRIQHDITARGSCNVMAALHTVAQKPGLDLSRFHQILWASIWDPS